MCVPVITVIAPFTSSTLGGTSGQHHLDTHKPYMATAIRDGVSWVASQQQEESFKMVITYVCMSDSARISHLCHSLSFSPSDFLLTEFTSSFFLISSLLFHTFLSLP